MIHAFALGVLALTGPSVEAPQVLFVTHSAGYEHGVVARSGGELALAEQVLVEMARTRGIEVTVSQDCGVLASDRLAAFDAVAFYTTGELPIPDEHRSHLVEWVRGGGAFVGIHPATDTFYEYPAYQDMLGGVFDGHPWTQAVRVRVLDNGHPSTRDLSGGFEIDDEIYQFRRFTAAPLRVLLELDAASVEIQRGNRADKRYALAWCRPWGRGRVFYTALGHRPEVWRDSRFQSHLLGGLEWALSDAPLDVPRPPGARALTRVSSGTWAMDAEGLGEAKARGWRDNVQFHFEWRVDARSEQDLAEIGVILGGRHILPLAFAQDSEGEEKDRWHFCDVVLKRSADPSNRLSVSVWSDGIGVPLETELEDLGAAPPTGEGAGSRSPFSIRAQSERVRLRNAWVRAAATPSSSK